MASKVASIYVAGLQCTSRYVDHFLVEVYSDSGLTTLVGSQTSTAQWDGVSVNYQKDFICFNGLVFGNTYYLRSTAVTPISGAVNWSSTLTLVAGEAAAPEGVTYTGTYTSTFSGINLYVTPANIPSDINHYEAIWTWDGSVPPDASAALASPLVTDLSGKFNLFVGGVPTNSTQVWIRAVNTSGLKQTWYSLGTFAVNATAGIIQGATGVNSNLIPDSDFKFNIGNGTGTALSYWNGPPPPSGQWTRVSGGGYQGINALAAPTTGELISSIPFNVPAQTECTLSCYVDSTFATTGGGYLGIYSPDLSTLYGTVGQVPGSAGRLSVTFTLPVGVITAIAVIHCDPYITSPAGKHVLFSAPMLQIGSEMTAYVSGIFDNGNGVISFSAMPTGIQSAVTPKGEVLNFGNNTGTHMQANGAGSIGLYDSNGNLINNAAIPKRGVSTSSYLSTNGITVNDGDEIFFNRSFPVVDPDFSQGGSAWNLQSGWSIQSGTGYGGSGFYAIYQGLSTAAIGDPTPFRCGPGTTITVTAQVEGSAGATGNAVVGLDYYSGTPTSLNLLASNNSSPAIANIGWNQVSITATAPAGTTYAGINFAVFGETAGFWILGEVLANIEKYLVDSNGNAIDGITSPPIVQLTPINPPASLGLFEAADINANSFIVNSKTVSETSYANMTLTNHIITYNSGYSNTTLSTSHDAYLESEIYGTTGDGQNIVQIDFAVAMNADNIRSGSAGTYTPSSQSTSTSIDHLNVGTVTQPSSVIGGFPSVPIVSGQTVTLNTTVSWSYQNLGEFNAKTMTIAFQYSANGGSTWTTYYSEVQSWNNFGSGDTASFGPQGKGATLTGVSNLSSIQARVLITANGGADTELQASGSISAINVQVTTGGPPAYSGEATFVAQVFNSDMSVILAETEIGVDWSSDGGSYSGGASLGVLIADGTAFTVRYYATSDLSVVGLLGSADAFEPRATVSGATSVNGLDFTAFILEGW